MESDGDQIIENLRELSGPAYASHDAQSLLIRSSALVSCLKSLNRAANTATRTKKDETTAARHEMDQSHLGLQNLLYEKRHLEREIEKCRQFAYVVFLCHHSGSPNVHAALCIRISRSTRWRNFNNRLQKRLELLRSLRMSTN